MVQIEEIKNKISKIKPFLETTYHVKEIGVFGSYIKGEQTQESDLDILISFSEYPSLFTYVEIENYLKNEIGVRVDLVMKSALKPFIGKRILEEVVYL